MVADRMARGFVVFFKEAGDSPRPAMEAGGCAFPVNFRVVFGDVDAAVPCEGRNMPDVQLRNEVRPLRLRAEKIGFQRPVMSLPPSRHDPVDLLIQPLPVCHGRL